MMDAVQNCVFGQRDAYKTLEFEEKGQIIQVGAGVFVKKLFKESMIRALKLPRLVFPIIDDIFIGSDERELKRNIQRFRDFIGELVRKRREELKDPGFEGHDFLTLLVTDELFKDNDSLIKDECATFFIAATQTTATLISNALYFMTQFPEVRKKVIQELKSNIGA